MNDPFAPTDEPNALDAMDAGIRRGDGDAEIKETEQKAVDATIKEFNGARQFDEGARRGYNRDRRYAAGKSDKTWKSNANVIGSHIDILKSFIYAENPDVSCRPGLKAGEQPTEEDVQFGETAEIVISKLWKRANLKKKARRIVASALTTGPGVLKALMYSDKRQNPQLEKELKDMRDNLARVQQLQVELTEPEASDADSHDAKVTEIQDQITGLEAKVEKLVSKGLCLDFIRSEDFQVSLDVATISDHLEADWNSNDLYVRKAQLRTKFPRLTASDVKSAVTYYQASPVSDKTDGIYAQESRKDDAASAEGAFTKSKPGQGASGTMAEDGKSVEFARVTEMWCRNENVIKTFVDGVKRWAVEPYAPPQGSSRFYCYFLLEFYEVDGERHPQSLPAREWKLQDEYASRRSNGAEVRERSVPMKVFNKGQIDPTEAENIRKGQNMELVGLQLTDPNGDVSKAVGVLSAPNIQWQAYDTSDIQRDMETMSGVQEAMQQAPTAGVTATAIETGNKGFASRTGADRDALETLLTDLALYTLETALQALTREDAIRLAGPLAFWPEGMDYEDISELLDVEIVAGSTGKPQDRADKETMATLMPIVERFITSIPPMEMSGQPVLLAQAKGFRNLLTMVLKSMDSRMSVDQILPAPVQTLLPPGAPGAEGVVPGQPPAPGGTPPAQPPVGNGTINKPQPTPPPA